MSYIRFNVPILLTLMRIVMIPMMMVVFYLPIEYANQITVAVYFTASITDWFDGYLARKWNQTSALGAFLDPVADKIIVAVALVMLVSSNPSWVFVLPATIVIGREITISALREWMAEIGQKAQVAVSTIAKIKTAAQMLSIGFLFYHDPIGNFEPHLVGLVLLYIAAILTIWSMVVYLRASWLVLHIEDDLAGR